MTASTRGFWPLRDAPVLIWLVLAAGVALAHPLVPTPRWLLIHLLLLGALTHAILVWSRYFADALLRTPPQPADRPHQSLRLALVNAGVALVVAGVLASWWPVVVAGATAVAGAVVWHGLDLAGRMRRALPSRFSFAVRYYVAAAAFLPVGATLGAILARGLADPLEGHLRLAHAALNLLGWVGLTFVGTVMTLWPTVLRTRMDADAEQATRRALPPLIAGVVVTAAAAAAGQRLVVATGLLLYLAGLALAAAPFARTGWRRRPTAFAPWSLVAGFAWLVAVLAVLAIGVALAPDWEAVNARVAWATPLLAAGFAAQILLGALSHLIPVARGGGPAKVRAGTAELDRLAGFRLALVNAGLVVAAFDVPSVVRVVATSLVLLGLLLFLFLFVRAMRAAPAATAPQPHEPAAPPESATPAPRRGAVAGLAVVALAVAAAVAVDPAAVSGARGDAAPVDAPTQVVQVEARDMRFHPGEIEVSAGTHLVLEVHNTDPALVHDLVLADGTRTPRLAPGDSATVETFVTADLDGWCSVVGHRQMGMVLSIRATGAGAAPAPTDAGADAGAMHPPSHASTPPAGRGQATPAVAARDATLPPLEDAVEHRLTLTVTEQQLEVAPGVQQTLWTYNGTAPGPVLHGRVGDTFEITLVNDGTIGHSVDFHAGALAPDRPMRTIAPGERLVYRFTAGRAGIWMYHCSTMPMSAHIANGMFGAVIIEPEGLPPVDRSYVLVQSEFYLGANGAEVDTAKLAAESPDLVAFNGYANQYDFAPIEARAGERVRVWVLDAGPNRATSFHVVGGQFDTTWAEGAYLLRDDPGSGSQALALGAAQGGFVEIVFPEAGHYPFVSHVMVDAERGAHGIFVVSE